MIAAEATIRGRGEPPEMPWPLIHVWEWFCTLCGGRRGTEPLAFADIEAWSRMTGAMIRPSELALIKRLDFAWMEITAEKVKKHGRGASGERGGVSGRNTGGVKAVLRGAAK